MTIPHLTSAIDIFVPPEQVIDTVDLYFLKARQRRLSLKFLSWFVLHEHPDHDTHDSIEDARSTLMLYKAYHEFEEKGIFDQKLEELYKAGRQHVKHDLVCRYLSTYVGTQNWKPPQPEGTAPLIPQPRGSTDSPAPRLPQFTISTSNLLQPTPSFSQDNYPSRHSASPGPPFFTPPPNSYTQQNWRQTRR